MTRRKKPIKKIYKDIMKLVKKGEDEILKISSKGKVNFEIALLNLKKEQLFYRLGKSVSKHLKLLSKNKQIKKMAQELTELKSQIKLRKHILDRLH